MFTPILFTSLFKLPIYKKAMSLNTVFLSIDPDLAKIAQIYK